MNPQYHYDNTCLHINGAPFEWKLHLKPKPHALSNMPGKGWRPDSPDFRILSYSIDKPDPSINEFRSNIPDEFTTIVEPFPTHQWMLLRLLYERKQCVELAQNNPVLAYAIANTPEFRNPNGFNEISFLGFMCFKKQKMLLDWLGFPPNPATVRLFQKIAPESTNPSILRMLRSVLKSGELTKLLGHLRHINAGVLGLVTRNNLANLLSPRLLAEVSERPEEKSKAETCDLLYETRAMYQSIRVVYKIKSPPLSSLKNIKNFHDELLPLYNKVKITGNDILKARKLVRPFPEPPFPGTESIVPVKNGIDLIEEGRQMHHCAATYEDDIHSNLCYIYKVIHPERATIGLNRNSSGDWYVSQVKGKCNKEVALETRQIITQWMMNSGLKKRMISKSELQGAGWLMD